MAEEGGRSQIVYSKYLEVRP